MNEPDSINEQDDRLLLLRYLDGSLSPEAVAKLNARLKHHAELRRELAGLLVQEIQLAELGHAKRAAIHATSRADGTASATQEPHPLTPSLAPSGGEGARLVRRSLGEGGRAGEGVNEFIETTREPCAEKKLVHVPAWVWRGWTRPRHASWAFAAAAGLALLCGIAVLWLNPRTGLPVLALVPDAQLQLEREGNAMVVSDRVPLRPGDVLNLAGTNTVAITYAPEQTRVEIEPGTTLRLLEWSQGKRFELRQGKLEANVARQRPFKPLLARTPQAEARVLGTWFTLTVTNNETHLNVAEGKVRLTRTSDGSHVNVPAKHYTIAAANVELAALPQTGSILREYWRNIPGTDETDESFPNRPDGREFLLRFEVSPNWGDNFGDRIRGYLHPPKTGRYAFFLSGDKDSRLWLSPDENPEGKMPIAWADESAAGEWTKSRSQQSPALTLTAGKRYYIEAERKCGSGPDYLAVAWQPPGGQREIIPGEFLSPFKPKPKEKKP